MNEKTMHASLIGLNYAKHAMSDSWEGFMQLQFVYFAPKYKLINAHLHFTKNELCKTLDESILLISFYTLVLCFLVLNSPLDYS